MPIVSTNPVVKDGKTYPYFMVNLAISPIIRNDVEPEYIGGSVAMRLTPYLQNQDGSFESLPDDAKSIVYFDVFQEIDGGDIALGKVVSGIMGSIQEYINDKGL